MIHTFLRILESKPSSPDYLLLLNGVFSLAYTTNVHVVDCGMLLQVATSYPLCESYRILQIAEGTQPPMKSLISPYYLKEFEITEEVVELHNGLPFLSSATILLALIENGYTNLSVQEKYRIAERLSAKPKPRTRQQSIPADAVIVECYGREDDLKPFSLEVLHQTVTALLGDSL